MERKLPAGKWELRVVDEAHHHVAETIRLAKSTHQERAWSLMRPRTYGGVEPDRKVTLWPSGEIPVRVQTPQGAPVFAITAAREWEPKNAFYRAFEFRTSVTPLDSTTPEALSKPHAVFHRPSGRYDNVLIADDVVGTLEVREQPPFWVGIWLHGEFHSSMVLEPDTKELIFTVSEDDLFRRAGAVRFRVIDRDSRQPMLGDVHATLKAEHAPYRRGDMKRVQPDERGAVAFTHVFPGDYDLTVECAGSFAQRLIVVRARETIDLGTIELRAGEALPLYVKDQDGQPVRATIEITNYVPGGAVKDLYHPNLFRHADEAGLYSLPVPDHLSIVRARYSNAGGPSSIATANVLLDPDALPLKLELTASHAITKRVAVEGAWESGHRLDFKDPALNLILATIERPGETLVLLPGDYEAQHFDAKGHLIGRRMITVADDPTQIVVP